MLALVGRAREILPFSQIETLYPLQSQAPTMTLEKTRGLKMNS